MKITIERDDPSACLEIRLFNAALAEARRRLPGESEADQLVYVGRKLATLLAWTHGYDVDRAGAEQMIQKMLTAAAAVPAEQKPRIQ